MRKQIRRVRIYDGYKDRDLVAAFRNQGVQVMVGVGNQDVIRIARGRPNVALDWLKNNIGPHADQVPFRCILVGGNNMLKNFKIDVFY
ncbi:unnamed protein product [Linum tenue]|uniref:glucan endo-1,3-beta-D-glucosidase n=1 Tax=Linum tenue TaxID=586396 RepID=A0AAV0R8C5_9ROSI|nr:unnamed protein product [Linum tenue]